MRMDLFFFFSSRRRHTRLVSDWSSDVCSSDLILCLFRFLLPSQEIRIAGGREVHLRSQQPLALYPANSIFVGDYLTTAGQSATQDYAMVRDAGFTLEAPDGSPLANETP